MTLDSGDSGSRHLSIVEEILHFNDTGYAAGPERELLSALLFDGIQSFLNFAKRDGSEARARFREAYSWIHKKGDEYIFSFDSVCEGLGIDPEFLRYGLANVCATNALKGKRRGTRL
jgi:hypothetical protein